MAATGDNKYSVKPGIYVRSAPWRVYLFGLVPISPPMASPMPKKDNSGVRRWLQPFVTLKEDGYPPRPSAGRSVTGTGYNGS